MSAELHHRAIRTERLRATAEIPDRIVRIRERRTTNPGGAKVFLSDAQAEAAVNDTAATANKASVTNRTCINRSILIPLSAPPRSLNN
jgi:hypothetical protein